MNLIPPKIPEDVNNSRTWVVEFTDEELREIEEDAERLAKYHEKKDSPVTKTD